MKENFTHVCCITDRSGSMASIRDDVIGGFNSFVQEQCCQPGDCTMTYVQFDDRYEIVFTDTPMQQVPNLTDETFVPRGTTALLDAVGKTIVQQGERLAAMNEHDRPGKVICLIITDGMENASREYKREQVRNMIQHQTEKYQWEFIYLGADAQAFQEAHDIGIKLGNIVRFAGTKKGAKAAYGVATSAVSSYRAGGDVDNLVRNAVQDQDDQSDLDVPDDPVDPDAN